MLRRELWRCSHEGLTASFRGESSSKTLRGKHNFQIARRSSRGSSGNRINIVSLGLIQGKQICCSSPWCDVLPAFLSGSWVHGIQPRDRAGIGFQSQTIPSANHSVQGPKIYCNSQGAWPKLFVVLVADTQPIIAEPEQAPPTKIGCATLTHWAMRKRCL